LQSDHRRESTRDLRIAKLTPVPLDYQTLTMHLRLNNVMQAIFAIDGSAFDGSVTDDAATDGSATDGPAECLHCVPVLQSRLLYIVLLMTVPVFSDPVPIVLSFTIPVLILTVPIRTVPVLAIPILIVSVLMLYQIELSSRVPVLMVPSSDDL